MMTRREFLCHTAVGAAGVGLATLLPGQNLLAALLTSQSDYAGFNMGLQTYSLRAFDFDRTLEIMKDLGLKHAQFFGGGKQMAITDDKSKIEGWKQKLKDAGITIMSFGVERFTKDAEATKKKFEFAKAMGFNVFTAAPAADSFESLAALTKEYGIKIAIHNHGPQDKAYGKLDQVVAATEKWPEAIGACVDTGHVLRSGEDPAAWIRKLGPRVHDIHLKDFADEKTEHILGKGKLDVLGVLKALKEVKFSGILAVEYEKNEKDPVADIKEGLAVVRDACKKL